MPRAAAVLCLACLAATAALASWRSSLYPETGYDPAAANLDTDKVLQDFSYAGYRAGAAALPDRTGPVFDVTAAPYQADPTGVTDATAAIQSAINAAESAGGGVVYLPAGTYRLSVPAAQTQALLIDAGNVVLRGAGAGQTFLLNTTTTNLRSKAVIRVRDGTEMSFYRTSGTTSVALSRDLLNSTTVIPVASTAGFAVGDTVVVRNDIGDDWINEHGETLWLGQGSSLGGLTYRRTVVAVDPVAKTLTVDAPTRYALKLRDGARVVRLTRAPIAEIGLEDFSFANVQSEATTGWGEDDYGISGTAAYEINGFFFIVFERVKDSWMRRLATYQPAGNTTTAHLLSGAFSARECTHLTVEHCFFQRPQYGGGGGNGYMFRLLDTGESLIQSCEARFSRHGFQFSGTGAAGNVIHASLDAITGRATGAVGAAGYATGGRASDHHQHFSQANLVDTCTAEDSWFEARYRGTSGTVPHGISAAHSVFWNTAGTGTSTQAVVKSEQARYGYVIGTRGNRTNVDILNTT
ncbi:MAG: glycoside hydrolase family 55 protein, partial [Candidatus Didemnitutus sp.]|nr:glycoside hydrolase family 55 protein [Candidatus Didemnitutus sp.]